MVPVSVSVSVRVPVRVRVRVRVRVIPKPVLISSATLKIFCKSKLVFRMRAIFETDAIYSLLLFI